MSWPIPISRLSLPGRHLSRYDLMKADAQRILVAMRAGARLHHSNEGGPRWRLSDGTRVDAEVAALVIANPEVIADADTLIAGVLSQTFTIKPREGI